MSTSFIGIAVIALVVAVDNALLAGLLLPTRTSRPQKKWMLTILGVLLGSSQIVLAASVDQLLHNMIFRVIAIVLLGWMCIRTLGMIPHTRATGLVWGAVAKLWMFTVFGNLDNMIWLGSELKGDRLGLILSSIGTIPVFVLVGIFLSRQIEKQQWILPLGAGMMAWAAAALILDTQFMTLFVSNLDDAPRTTFQCLITIVILGIGFGIQRVMGRRT